MKSTVKTSDMTLLFIELAFTIAICHPQRAPRLQVSLDQWHWLNHLPSPFTILDAIIDCEFLLTYCSLPYHPYKLLTLSVMAVVWLRELWKFLSNDRPPHLYMWWPQTTLSLIASPSILKEKLTYTTAILSFYSHLTSSSYSQLHHAVNHQWPHTFSGMVNFNPRYLAHFLI